jgi:hypothetical protein
MYVRKGCLHVCTYVYVCVYASYKHVHTKTQTQTQTHQDTGTVTDTKWLSATPCRVTSPLGTFGPNHPLDLAAPPLKRVFNRVVFALAGYLEVCVFITAVPITKLFLEVGQVMAFWDRIFAWERIFAWDSLLVAPIAASAILAFREKRLVECMFADQVNHEPRTSLSHAATVLPRYWWCSYCSSLKRSKRLLGPPVLLGRRRVAL